MTMRKSLLVFSFTLCCIGLSAQTDNLPAFPGAEGHGRYTTGGRGGKVYTVNSLEDSDTKGTLRWALGQKETRTIVFNVSGTIHLKSELKTGSDNLTIAGQTSPGGICIADYPLVINSNNVIIRFLRFRPGDTSGSEPDGLGGTDKKNIIIDHCSVSWSVDECLSVYGMENSTVQWCIASEALRVSTHGKGTHGYGGNWGGNKASYHHNLIAHCESRTPRLGPRYTTQENEYVDIRNNVIYNWAGEGCYGGEAQHVNIVNNYYKPGPATDQASSKTQYRIAKIGVRTEEYIQNNSEYAPTLHQWGTFYIDGNIMEGNDEVTEDNWTKGVYAQQTNNEDVDFLWTEETRKAIKLDMPLDAGSVTTHSAAMAYERVLEYAGCCLYRDAVDERIINDTRNRQATYTADGNKPGYINSQNDQKPDDWAEAWPELPTDTSIETRDTDGDGIPDAYEKANGLNYRSASDGNEVAENGYTNLENYLNSLVEDIVSKQNEGNLSGNPTIESTTDAGKVSIHLQGNTLLVQSTGTIANISLFALTGRKILEASPENWKAELQLGELPQGIYIVHTTHDNNLPDTQKLIINK